MTDIEKQASDWIWLIVVIAIEVVVIVILIIYVNRYKDTHCKNRKFKDTTYFNLPDGNCSDQLYWDISTWHQKYPKIENDSIVFSPTSYPPACREITDQQLISSCAKESTCQGWTRNNNNPADCSILSTKENGPKYCCNAGPNYNHYGSIKGYWQSGKENGPEKC